MFLIFQFRIIKMRSSMSFLAIVLTFINILHIDALSIDIYSSSEDHQVVRLIGKCLHEHGVHHKYYYLSCSRFFWAVL